MKGNKLAVTTLREYFDVLEKIFVGAPRIVGIPVLSGDVEEFKALGIPLVDLEEGERIEGQFVVKDR